LFLVFLLTRESLEEEGESEVSDRKRKDFETIEPSDPHLSEAYLLEGVEKHVPPVMAPVSVAPMPSQLIAPIPLLPPEAPSIHQEGIDRYRGRSRSEKDRGQEDGPLVSAR